MSDYEIRTSDNTLLATIKEGKGINNDIISGIGLIAKLTSGYGATQSENFVHLAENFANIEEPKNPIEGQLFYNKSNSCLYLYKCVSTNLSDKSDSRTLKWEKMLTILTEKNDDNSYQTGDLYFDTQENLFQIYKKTSENSGVWIDIGPNNYNVKRNSYKVVETDSDKKGTVEIDFDPNCTNLVTMKVVASEISLSSASLSCASWVYRFMVQTYNNTYQGIGTPTYELIGRTDDFAKDWEIEFIDFNDNNKLKIDVSGKGHSDNSKIKWVFDIEVVKA